MRADRLKIESIHTTLSGGVGVDFKLLDGKGKVTERHVMAWRTKDELDHFMDLASIQELIRSALREKFST